MPQVIMVDGNGILHQRMFGSACHIGVVCDIPTIGVAKKLLYVNGLKEDEVEDTIRNKLKNKGDFEYLYESNGKSIMGAVLRPTSGSKNPIFVSVGHCLCLDTALDIVNSCCDEKIPEPIRQADLRSRQVVKSKLKKATKK